MNNLIEGMILDGIDDFGEMKTASGSLKQSATFFMPIVNDVRVKREWFGGVKTSITGGDTENLTNTIEVPEANNKLPNNGVEARAKTAAGDNSNSGVGRVRFQVDFATGTGGAVSEASRVRENEVVLCDVESFDLLSVKVRVVI